MVRSIIDAVVLWIESFSQSHQAMKRMEHIKANDVTPGLFYPKLCVIIGPLRLHLLLGRIHVTVYEIGLDCARRIWRFQHTRNKFFPGLVNLWSWISDVFDFRWVRYVHLTLFRVCRAAGEAYLLNLNMRLRWGEISSITSCKRTI